MNLSLEDTNQFYKLMWGLQLYINSQLRILPGIEKVDELASLSTEEKARVRAVLWEHPELIDAYIKENPELLPAEEVQIIRRWKQFVSGTFQIYRLLKKHAIFIAQDSKIYGVLGLYDSLEDIFYGRTLPVMVEAVLLPFKGRIVYDGLLTSYNIYFGRGIRSSLHEEYMAAKQNDRIITSLEIEIEKAQPTRKKLKKTAANWEPVVKELVENAEKLKGGLAQQNAAFTLLRACAYLTQATVRNPNELNEIWHLESKVRRALSRFQNTLQRLE